VADPADTNRMLQWKLAGILERHVERIFKPGTKLTIIARTPGNDEADVLVTSDSLNELAKLVERSKTRPDTDGVRATPKASDESVTARAERTVPTPNTGA